VTLETVRLLFNTQILVSGVLGPDPIVHRIYLFREIHIAYILNLIVYDCFSPIFAPPTEKVVPVPMRITTRPQNRLYREVVRSISVVMKIIKGQQCDVIPQLKAKMFTSRMTHLFTR